MNVIGHVNALLSKTLGLKVVRTRWRQNTDLTLLDPKPIGFVDHFGRKEVTGWISAAVSDGPIKVTVNVNDYPIISTWVDASIPADSTQKAQSFYIGVKGIWEFCNKTDWLSIRVGDRILPILDEGLFIKPRNNGEKNLDELEDMLANGYVFNKFGAFQLSKKSDTHWQKQMMAFYKEITKILEKQFGVTPFVIYGTLLGQVREGGFIGHDDDFDIAYLSKHRNGPDAVKELIAIAKALKKKGFGIELRASTIHIHHREDPKLRIDLFHLLFNESDELAFAFGVAGTSKFTIDDWAGITKGTFAGYTVSVPKNAEKLVECIYGSNWRTPITGFNWKNARTRREKPAIVPRNIRNEFNGTTSNN